MDLPARREGPPKSLAQPDELPVSMQTAWVMRGRVIQCSHCQGIVFEKRDVMLNSRAMEFLNVAWLNEGAAALVCGHCTHIEWFAQAPQLEPLPSTSASPRQPG